MFFDLLKDRLVTCKLQLIFFQTVVHLMNVKGAIVGAVGGVAAFEVLGYINATLGGLLSIDAWVGAMVSPIAGAVVGYNYL